jgi:hypothetical protein
MSRALGTMGSVRWLVLILSNAMVFADKTLGQPADKQNQSGPATKEERVIAYDYEEKQAYHSPQTPGWAGWIALWKMRGGDVMLSLLQITGDTSRPPSHNMLGLKKENILLRSSDNGNTWKQVADIVVVDDPFPPGWVFNGGSFAAVQQLADGSLLGTRYGRDWGSFGPKDGLIFRSTDSGKTWSEPRRFNDLEETSAAPSRLQQLRDGTVMIAYQGGKAGYPDSGRWSHAGVYLSHDLGRTWEGPDIIAPDDDGLVAYPEPSFVEFDDGELFFLFRIEQFPDPKDESKCISTPRRQCLVRKKRGHYVAGAITETTLPHAGHPELLLTREGVLLYMCEAGYWYSLDRGFKWTKMDIRPSYYYPQAVQLDDGRILVAGHVGGDEPFPPPQDMTVRCQWFRVRRESK